MAEQNSEKMKALQAAMQKIEKSYGHGSIMRMADENIEQVDVIPTGSIKIWLSHYLLYSHYLTGGRRILRRAKVPATSLKIQFLTIIYQQRQPLWLKQILCHSLNHFWGERVQLRKCFFHTLKFVVMKEGFSHVERIILKVVARHTNLTLYLLHTCAEFGV